MSHTVVPTKRSIFFLYKYKMLLLGVFLILYSPIFYFKLLPHLKVDTARASCVVLISSLEALMRVAPSIFLPYLLQKE